MVDRSTLTHGGKCGLPLLALSRYPTPIMPALEYDGTVHRFEGDCVIGRHRECTVQVRADGVSRQHARITISAGAAHLEDLESANGTRLNGKRIAARTLLRDGDVLRLGHAELTFQDTERLPDLLGTQIGDYRLESLVGRGLVGGVYRARQIRLDRLVAFKVLDPRFGLNNPGFAERFLHAVNHAASINHEGLVKLHECGQHEGLLWYSMELAEGETLEGLLKRDGVVAPPLALLIIDRAARALQAAHAADVVHGDLRPATIMVTEAGTVKVLDLGLVGLTGREGIAARARATVKQAMYLCPTQSRGSLADRRADVYALGCVLLHLLTGKPPFTGDDLEEVIAAHEHVPVPALAASLHLPKAFDDLVQGMLSKKVDWRFAGMDEVLSVLADVRTKLAGTASEPPAKVVAKPSPARSAPRRPVADKVVSDWDQQVPRLVRVLLTAGGVMVAVVLVLVFGPSLAKGLFTPAAAAPGGTAQVHQPAVAPAHQAVAPVVAATATASRPSSALMSRWLAVEQGVLASARAGDWGAAEMDLSEFAALVSRQEPGGSVAAAVAVRRRQLALDAAAWYRLQVQALPSGNQPTDLAKRLTALAKLRDAVGSLDRADATARHQEVLDRLGHMLAEARRSARQALEAGKFAELTAISARLAPAYAGTAIAGVFDQFAAQCREAAAAAPQWRIGWADTKVALGRATGATALPAGAAMMLAGDDAAARRLLADPALASGDLLARREALSGRAVAVLAFADPADLARLSVQQGTPVLSGGRLAGSAKEPALFSIDTPLVGDTWEVAATVGRTGTGDVIMVLTASDPVVQVRLAPDQTIVTLPGVTGAEGLTDPDPGTGRLRMRCVQGQLTIDLDGRVLGRWSGVELPAGSHLQFAASEVAWAVDDVLVVGGH